ncbi:MAG: asparagine synthase-related protein [Cognaticolwellia sp.]
MSWTGLIPHVKVGFAGWIECQAFDDINVETSELKWQSEMFLLESISAFLFQSTNSGWLIFAQGLNGVEFDDICDKIDNETILAEIEISDKEIFSELKKDITDLLLPGAVIFAIQPTLGRVVVLRDACGFIPIYYHFSQNRLVFSSNLATVRANTQYNGINTDKINEMLVYAHRTGKRTLWQNLNAISPGGVSVFTQNQLAVHQWLLTEPSQYNPELQAKFKSLSESALLLEIKKAMDKALEPLAHEPHVSVPCGGGVDSSFLGAYLAQRGQDVTFWCINQPDAPVSEDEWMKPLSKQLNIPCEYANLNKQVFLENLLERMFQAQQPMTGPNAVGGIYARKLALEAGDKVFISGEGADTVFGGLSPFARLTPLVSLFRMLAKLPKRLRMQLDRGLISDPAWVMDMSQVAPTEDLARIAMGDIERAELLAEVLKFPANSSTKERFADIFSWVQLKEVPTGLNHIFFEKDEFEGGITHYPFAHQALINLGLHLPYQYKVNQGHKKWLWRKFTSEYIGHDVAFRKKYAFPTLTHIWLEPSATLLKGGFLQDLLCANVASVFGSLPKSDPARWTLLNIELWGRIHCLGEQKSQLLNTMMSEN